MQAQKFKKGEILHNILFHDISAEGLGIGKTNDGVVVFAENVVPGDVADIQITKPKNNYIVGFPTQITKLSESRTQPFCKHFGYCGGCKWQHLSYPAQLTFKKKFVEDALTRIGKLSLENIADSLPSENIKFYRNKLEFTFSNRKWIEPSQFNKENIDYAPALGFHIAGHYNKVIDITECYLQHDYSNQIKNFIREYALKNNLSFFDIKHQAGFLRTLIIRNTTLNQWMVILGIYEVLQDELSLLLDSLLQKFPFITSLYYAHLYQVNDSLNNGKLCLYKGSAYIEEQLGHLKFQISPNSFFQTNSLQAKIMYDKVLEYADLKGNEIVYDLYCGTGTIGLYLAKKAKKIIGVEYIEAAVKDAKINADLNNINNTEFFAGDIKNILNDEFIAAHGSPSVIVIDPPRAGLHEDVVNKIIEIAPEKIIYVSCNPASQARDLVFFSETYMVKNIQPIDMFPHTTHAENIVLLKRK